MPPLKTLKEKLTGKFLILENGCWDWISRLNKGGYGRLEITPEPKKPKTILAHRASYEAYKGPPPPFLDHTCHNDSDCLGGPMCRHRRCINPDHLEGVTIGENTRRSKHTHSGRNIRKTHCPYGHPYSGDNLRIAANGRHCAACIPRHRRNRREKNRVYLKQWLANHPHYFQDRKRKQREGATKP